MLHLSNNLKKKKRRKKRNINNDLAILPSHDSMWKSMTLSSEIKIAQSNWQAS